MMIKAFIKLTLALSIFYILTALTISAQTKIDEFGYSNAEDSMARVDNFLVALQDVPGSKGVVIIYGPRKPKKGEVAAHIRQFPFYLNFRHFDKNKITIVNGGYRDSDGVSLEFFTVAPGEPKPEPSGTLTIKEVKFLKSRFRGTSLYLG
jgi:hypothetical protein